VLFQGPVELAPQPPLYGKPGVVDLFQERERLNTNGLYARFDLGV
jgi:hypothetical protein